MRRAALAFVVAAVLGLTGGAPSEATAQDSTAQCQGFIDGYIRSNALYPSVQARKDALDMCGSGLRNALKILEISTDQTMTRCEENLRMVLRANGVQESGGANWGVAMGLCAQGKMDQARQALVDGAAVPTVRREGWTRPVQRPVATPEPMAAEPMAPEPMAEAPAQPPRQAVPRRAGPRRTVAECINQLDRYVQSLQLAPAGADFQRAVEQCVAGDADLAQGVLRDSDAATRARCEPALNQHVVEQGLGEPSRMLWMSALDLCANGKMDQARAELRRVGAATAPRANMPDGLTLSDMRGGGPFDPKAGDRLTDADGRFIGADDPMPRPNGDHLLARATCVAELNRFMLDNQLVAGTVEMERAIELCRQGRQEAAKKELNFANNEARGRCETPLYQVVKANELSPTQRWWYGALTLCAQGKMDEAEAMLMGSLPTDMGSRTLPIPNDRLDREAPMSMMNGDTQPRALTPAVGTPGTDCVSTLDRVVAENGLVPSNDAFQDAVRSCAQGDQKRMRRIVFDSSANTLAICEPALNKHIADRGLHRPSGSLWNTALVLCANGKMDQAKAMLGE